MTIKEFMKHVAAPIGTTIFLLALFQPLCTQNGECNYLMLWFLTGIPTGLQHLFLLVIPKGYDTGGAMAVLFLNLLMAGVIGGVLLTCRLMLAAVYLVDFIAAGMIHVAKLAVRNDRKR